MKYRKSFHQHKNVNQPQFPVESTITSLYENNPDAVYAIDLDGKITMVNRACERITGYAQEELIGQEIWRILSPTDELTEQELFQIAITGGQIETETESVHRNGSLIYLQVKRFPIYHHNKIVGAIGVVKDITLRKQLEKELVAVRENQRKTEEILHGQEAMLKLITDNSSDIIYLVDSEGIVRFISSSFTRILGYPIDIYLNQHATDSQFALELLHPEDLPLLNCRGYTGEHAKEPFQLEYRVKRQDGQWLHVESFIRPILVEDNTEGFVVIARDVTERKRNEELIRSSDKLSVLGELAAGIAHEIRNPLTSIKGFIQLFQSTDLEKSEYYRIILSELDRINFIVSELLILAKPQMTQYKSRNINEILSQTITLFYPQAILQGIELLAEFAEDAYVVCEENQLKQVFINVIKNSMEAMEDEGVIRVRTSKHNQSHVQIQVVDSGNGIPQDLIAKLGEPFYTTKAKGTGLGLMVSLKIIKDHHGTLDVESEESVGTTMTITLPMTQS